MSLIKKNLDRRGVLKGSAAAGLAAPMFFNGSAWADGHAYLNAPKGK